ncbi:MAG TPA: hypothetical protein VLM38_17320 [Blastocatellia bacterium]|nr:hypothetical protein [Blastocatellia bacterium]
MFHDRFIILDDKWHYHVGASIKDAGKKVFMISEIEDGYIVDALAKQFLKTWAAATALNF